MRDRTAVAKFGADIHRAVARHAESHQKQHGSDPGLEDRVKRHRAQARQLGFAIALSGKRSVAPASTHALAAPRERRETRTRKTGDDGDSGESDEPPPLRLLGLVLAESGYLTFEHFAELTPGLTPAERAELHSRLPELLQAEAWDALRAEIDWSRS
jgi:hypothetical protein